MEKGSIKWKHVQWESEGHVIICAEYQFCVCRFIRGLVGRKHPRAPIPHAPQVLQDSLIIK